MRRTSTLPQPRKLKLGKVTMLRRIVLGIIGTCIYHGKFSSPDGSCPLCNAE